MVIEKYSSLLLPMARSRKGIWESLLDQRVTESAYGPLMIDVSHIKAYPHTAGAKGGNQDIPIVIPPQKNRDQLRRGAKED